MSESSNQDRDFQGERSYGRDRGDRGDRGGDRGDRGPRRGGRRPHRGKTSEYVIENANYIDYKDIARLRSYMGDSGKILPRRMTGNTARHQRMVAQAIKRARYMALLPYVSQK
ncbi:MAG: 30S ribosomal protein S18 [Candidatus Sumerlaeia bacterium]